MLFLSGAPKDHFQVCQMINRGLACGPSQQKDDVNELQLAMVDWLEIGYMHTVSSGLGDLVFCAPKPRGC